MKILLFTDTIGDLNGVSRFIQDMAEGALQRGDNLQVIASTNKYYPPLQNIHNFKPSFSIPMPFYNELELAFTPRGVLEKFVREYKPDIIHISTPGPVGITGRKIAKRLGIPLLGTYHTDFPAYIRDNTGMEILKKLTDKWMGNFYKPFLHVFSRSYEYTDIMHKDIAIPKEKISIIRAGTNLKRFSSAHHNENIWAEYGLVKDVVKILYVGRITKEKNVSFLLQSWKSLKMKYPNLNAELIMVGEGNLKNRALEMQDIGVHYLGPIIGERLSEIYASSDIFVFPSVTDTLGQVVMESSASALPILVSDIGGPKSLLNPDTASGYSLQVKDERWVEHMRLLIEDEIHRKELGESAKNFMQSFSIDNSYEDFLGVHKQYFQRLNG